MRTGVHTSVKKGFVGALEEAHALGCETFQMFTQSPRGWKTRVYLDEEFQQFRLVRKKLNIFPVVVHAPYLPNLCTSNDELYEKSFHSLVADLDRCEKLGADYLVIHPGAYSPEADYQSGIKNITRAFNDALGQVPGTAKILVETMAGGGRRIGGPFQQLADILAGVRDQSRIGICFDTCHVLAAGYDIATPTGVDTTLKEFDDKIGLDRIHVFHVNDSKGACGSHRDLHQHLGEGHVGLTGLRHLFDRNQFSSCAYILETPKDLQPESDLKNLTTLRSLLPVYV